MKKRIYSQLMPTRKCLVLLILGIVFVSGISAQTVATYILKTGSGNPTAGTASPAPATNANVTAGTVNSNTSIITGTYSGSGVKIKMNNGQQTWPAAPSIGYSVDFPIAPKTGNDIHFTGISFIPVAGGIDQPEHLIVAPQYQVDGTGPWVPLGSPVTLVSTTPATPINVANVNDAFYSGHTYVIRFAVYGGTKASSMFMNTVVFNGTVTNPPASAPAVTTVSATATGKYTATINGSYDDNGANFYFVKESGTIWSTDQTKVKDSTLSTRTINAPNTTGIIADNITGLNAGVQYYAVSYIVTQFGIKYGAIIPFKTAAPTIPTVTINLTSVLSNKAGATGNILDSGGLVISEKGFIWNTAGNPTISSNLGKLYEGSGTASFTDFIKGLKPSTHYCVRAYAINSINPGYSNDTCFTTATPVPTLTAIPGTIDFGPNYYNNSALVLSYTLSGSNLTPAAGNITVTAPTGFLICATAGGTFTSTITIPYTNGSLSSRPVYVKMPTGAYGSPSGNIINSGGGVLAVNADMVFLTGSVIQSPIDVSNTGTDFWLGFGYEQSMDNASGGGKAANISVYIAAGPQGAKAVVELPGVPGAAGFPTAPLTIAPNSTIQVQGFPLGDANDELNATGQPDCRLFYTGISNRAIHVYSADGSPISVWMYTYEPGSGNSAAGSMIFPSNTWNSNYTVQAYGGTSNDGIPNSFFFVIANQDHTPVYFTPTQKIVDSSSNTVFADGNEAFPADVKYQAGTKDTIYLNRGQVFNAMGFVQGTGKNSANGLDLSGSTVSTDCDKKIAVFAGNGRCLINTLTTCINPSTGSDNLVQQMIPSVAWDTKYFTVPTKTMEHNLFRIYVKDPATQVWINDTAHGTASLLLTTAGNHPGTNFNGTYNFNGLFYVLETSTPMEIESNLPISVTQFITAGDCGSNSTVGNNGSGDPEMIILTGAQQAITSATVYSPNFKNGNTGGGYINVVIPHSGVSSFMLDKSALVDTGSSSFKGTAYKGYNNTATPSLTIPVSKAFVPYPADTSYYWAKLFVSYPATHTMSSNVPFNAIAYGVAGGESYGFNAGTQVKNLSAVFYTDNPGGHDSSATAVRTCVNNLVTLKIGLPYLPSLVDSIVWNPQSDTRITPNNSMKGTLNGSVAKYDTTILVDGRTFYIYSSPVPYSFGQLGTYRFPVTAYGRFASDCPGQDVQNMLVIVGHDQDNLSFQASCGNPLVTLSSDTIPIAGTNILKWTWNFGDGTPVVSGGSLDTMHTFPPGGAIYTVRLTTTNTVGCLSSDSIQVDFSGGLKADFGSSTNAICSGGSISFADNTTASGISGTPNKWTWDFGDGSNLDSVSGVNVTHIYTKVGKWKVILKVTTTAGCIDYAFDSVSIQGTPIASFTASSGCLGNPNTFTNNSSVPNNLGSIDSSFWDFGDGSAVSFTLGLAAATHTYATAGNYITTLYVKSDGGCISTPVTQKDTVFALPLSGFKTDVDCANLLVTYTDTSHTNGGTITEWDWDFDGDGVVDSVTANGTAFKHPYPGGNGQTYNPSLTIKTLAGCSNTSAANAHKFTIGVAPSASFTQSGTLCLPNALATFSNTSTISDGTGTQMTYIWHFADGSANADSSITIAAAPATATHTYTAAGTFNVSLTAKSNLGCTSTSATQPVVVNAQPSAVITPSQLADCLNDSLAFAGNATSGALAINQWAWSFGDNAGTDIRQNPKYQWKKAGTYNVGLVVSSAAGCKSDSAHQLIKVDSLPVAGFTLYSVDCSAQTVTVVDTSNAHGGTIVKWDWDFGDGSPAVSNTKGDTVKHVYTNGNGKSFFINLTVTTRDGCVNSSIPQGFKIGASPDVKFSPVSTTGLCLPNAVVTYNNNSSISDGTANAMSYIWHFGDGTPDSAVAAGNPPAPATHVYTSTVPDTVKLTALSNSGCTGSATFILNSIHPQPAAVINAPAAVCLYDSAALSGNDINSTSNWAWDFGDHIGTSAKQAPKYAWAAAGRYGISLTVTSTFGCISTPAIDSITVNPLPVADFTVAATTCEKNAIAFTDASSANVNNWVWDFGDATATVAQQSPSHTYTSANSYTVKLHITDINGCSSKPDKATAVTVNPLPQPGVSVLPICLTGASTTVTFTAANKGTASVANWQWHFDNDSIATGTTASYYYTHNGPQQSLELTGTSNLGCVDSVSFKDTVYSTPVSKDSIVNISSLCSNLPVTVLNQSYIPGVAGYGSISKIEIYWDYNQANPGLPDITDNAPVANKQYQKQYTALASDNNYTISLKAYSGNGCPAQSADSLITVHGSPLAAFAPLAPVCQEAAEFALAGGTQAGGPAGVGSYSGLGVISDSAFLPAQAGPGTHPIIYTIATTPYGCYDTAMQTITVYPTPVIDYGGTVSVMQGDSITLAPTHVVGSSLRYLWVPSIYLDSDTSATPVSRPADTVTYTITVKSPGSCQASTTLFVQVLRDFVVPNTFTPNNDGINDKWMIAELPNFPIQWVQIFDRYGQLLFESHGYGTPWDGTYKGKQLPAGTYYYIIEVNGLLTPKTGYVTILR